MPDLVLPDVIERTVRADSIVVRDDNGEGPGTLVGTAVVFDQRIELWGGRWPVYEEIDRHAFDGVKDDDVRALADHRRQVDAVLGRSGPGTLRTEITRSGIDIEIDLPDTRPAADLVTQIERGDVDGMSFAARIGDTEEKQLGKDGEDGTLIRHTRFSKWIDVAVVAFPAYPQTSVSVGVRDAVGAGPMVDALHRDRMRRRFMVARLATATRRHHANNQPVEGAST